MEDSFYEISVKTQGFLWFSIQKSKKTLWFNRDFIKTILHSWKIIKISEISVPGNEKTIFSMKNIGISVKTQMKPIVFFHCFLLKFSESL
jgi:hypothetical protein